MTVRLGREELTDSMTPNGILEGGREFFPKDKSRATGSVAKIRIHNYVDNHLDS